jgi:nitrite reductase/ring-hydroxylating ferredoxin subunit
MSKSGQVSGYFVLLSLLLLSTFFTNCSKNGDTTSSIPNVAVSFAINPNSTEYYRLNTVNGWEMLTGGYKGILVFRVSPDEFTAFERACPYDWQNSNARIVVDTSGITAYCPSCKSEFILLDGTPFKGPSHFSLKRYNATYDGSILYIYN